MQAHARQGWGMMNVMISAACGDARICTRVRLGFVLQTPHLIPSCSRLLLRSPSA
jgi:hypothetical protein